MGNTVTPPKPFEPGTTGWTADDLDDPAVEAEWERGRFEIIEGVLTTMPAAYFEGGEATTNLLVLVSSHLRSKGVRGGFASEVDIIIDTSRVVRADAVYLAPEDKRRQRSAAADAGREDLRRTRILVPPTLVIESISPGHERHDEHTKRRWYAEFGVSHYWPMNPFERTLQCLSLRGLTYAEDASGRDNDVVRPAAFPGLVISLQDVWAE
jgi:Uma2 family endonuclease